MYLVIIKQLALWLKVTISVVFLGVLTRRPSELSSLVLENALCAYVDEVRAPEPCKASVGEWQGDQDEGQEPVQAAHGVGSWPGSDCNGV